MYEAVSFYILYFQAGMDFKPSVVTILLTKSRDVIENLDSKEQNGATFDGVYSKSSKQVSIWSDSKPCKQMLTSEESKKAKWLKKQDLTLD